MKKTILALSVLLISYSAHAVRCSDFATQAQAQAYMHQNGAYKLDRDRDGIACEHLRR
ncbi:excalibur calcium-binding domain-containing protein [Mannheimia haemolytica]|uniref:excalibur calcium-binding domain-containing protein n=1 Tax=Mannheimia haemolytica TaxID=75985 RepID=UPI000F83C953|nr:excalibur calcium-binding domain-containing protein [Mannheimia haemolytica]UQX67233.1 excalibur calcium-binding domain-containing protein [Mannheimia haemolytica]